MSDEHIGMVDRDALRRYCERSMNIRSERRELTEAHGELMKEAKDAGFSSKMILGMVRELEMDEDARSVFYTTQNAYRRALDLGPFADTALGEAAVERDAAERRVARPKPLAQQPVRRGRGRPRKSGHDRVEEALATARAHLGNGGDPQPPAA